MLATLQNNNLPDQVATLESSYLQTRAVYTHYTSKCPNLKLAQYSVACKQTEYYFGTWAAGKAALEPTRMYSRRFQNNILSAYFKLRGIEAPAF